MITIGSRVRVKNFMKLKNEWVGEEGLVDYIGDHWYGVLINDSPLLFFEEEIEEVGDDSESEKLGKKNLEGLLYWRKHRSGMLF